MTGLEALQGVQFVSAKERRFAVLCAEDWEALIEWLETVEDISARQALAALMAAGGNRQQAGWSAWKDVAGEVD